MDDPLTQAFPACLLPDNLTLIPGLREVYELHLAWLEAQTLSGAALVQQAAYFCSVDGRPTRHFLTCVGETLKLPDFSSARLRSFFKTNSFRTGYATHGLFPYRGKFHPQMVRGILNVIGVGPGKTVLDPMMGSGTVPIEAALLGADAIGVDISPFCAFMTETKASGLTMSLARAEGAWTKAETTFDYFVRRHGVALSTAGQQLAQDDDLRRVMEEGTDYVVSGRRFRDRETAETYALLLLAFLDTMGYTQRSQRKPPLEQFQGVLERYLHCCRKFQQVRGAQGFDLGRIDARQGDARQLDLADESVDAILFSPPYSFAIDYAKNDAFHLAALGADRAHLDKSMIGLRGGSRLADKYDCYLEDMNGALRECHRVLKQGCHCVIVVGTNNNQLSKVLKLPADQVIGLHKILRDAAESLGFSFSAEIPRAIKGIANTMREEYIVFLKKE
ncbi:DNA methyltransferase [uncultured Thiohalocapsa sp.]|uniref:TRM11 family SAM-dependent methyltransferase n=1 Tax=uncultured Thiohalocapsa sp. TaxID=768990 RepID=UPI0025D2B973|nr:DNA methyltransferase [uncultured Thiohalocapsa sp.]